MNLEIEAHDWQRQIFEVILFPISVSLLGFFFVGGL